MANESVDNFFTGTSKRDNTLVVGGSFETGTGQNLKTRFFTLPIGDISGLDTFSISPGIAGSIVKITNVIDKAITMTDVVLDFKIGPTGGAGVAIEGAGITISFLSSNDGDVVQSIPTDVLMPTIPLTNVITATSFIKVARTGTSTAPSNAVLTFEILLS